MSERPLPPVTEIAMASLALIVAGGIYLSAHLPRHVPLGPAVALLAVSALLMAANLAALARVKDFAWKRFFAVAKWSLLAYAVIAGMIEYTFVRNHISGGALIVLTPSLIVFAVHVPTLVGFTVARYYELEDPRLRHRASLTPYASGHVAAGSNRVPLARARPGRDRRRPPRARLRAHRRDSAERAG